jgi:DNA/RNA endonuclease YhcR with UshA esterase domain
MTPMQENKQPNVCPDPQKALLDEVLCPGCGKFVGAYEKCPYCGTEMKKRISIIFFKRAALVLAFGGLALLWFTAVKMKPQLIHVSDINARYNNAVVEIRGIVESPKTTGKDAINFYVDDGTGTIKAQAFRGLAEMKKLGNIPHEGDQVSVIGSVQLTEKFGTSLMINIPAKVKVTPAKSEKVAIDKVTLERKGALVQVTGEIIVVDKRDIGTFLTIGDTTGTVEVPLFKSDLQRVKDKDRFTTVGNEITVIGVIGEFKGKPQIKVRDMEEIVTLPGDTIPSKSIPGYAESQQKTKELESKMSPNMRNAENIADSQEIMAY